MKPQPDQLSKDVLVCHECDLLLKNPQLKPGQKARCPRCNFALAARGKNTLNRLIALSLTALILLGLSNAFPFLGFAVGGNEQQITFWQGINALWLQGYPELSILTLIVIVIIPTLFLLSILYLLISFKNGIKPLYGRFFLDFISHLRPWSMVEVFSIGVLVSLIKIASMATIEPGISFWSFLLFCLIFPIIMAKTDRYELWQWFLYGYKDD